MGFVIEKAPEFPPQSFSIAGTKCVSPPAGTSVLSDNVDGILEQIVHGTPFQGRTKVFCLLRSQTLGQLHAVFEAGIVF
jgi:hypothetical protein